MNLNKLREAVKYFVKETQEDGYWDEPDNIDALDPLIALAEDVIRLQGVMPKEKQK